MGVAPRHMLRRDCFMADNRAADPHDRRDVRGRSSLTSGGRLTISIVSLLNLLFRDVPIQFCARRPLVRLSQFSPVFSTPLRPSLLTAAHRHGDHQHHQHACDRDDDYDHARCHGRHWYQ